MPLYELSLFVPLYKRLKMTWYVSGVTENLQVGNGPEQCSHLFGTFLKQVSEESVVCPFSESFLKGSIRSQRTHGGWVVADPCAWACSGTFINALFFLYDMFAHPVLNRYHFLS